MQQLYQNQAGITALAQNIAFTSATSGTFLRSGCRVVPNTTNTTAITANVESGSIALDSAAGPIGIASQSVELSPVPSNSDPDLTNARVDVIDLTQNGASVVEGNVNVKRPTQAAPYNDEIEGQWPSIVAPRPDDGGLVDGVGRAVVYLDETIGDSTDITAADIRNYDAFGQDAIVPDTLNAEVEGLPDPVDIEAQSATTFGAQHPNEYRRDTFCVTVPGERRPIAPGETAAVNMALPPGHRLRLRRVTAIDASGNLDSAARAAVTWSAGSGANDVFSTASQFAENDDGSPLGVVAAPGTGFKSVSFELTNTRSSGANVNSTTAMFFGDMVDDQFTPPAP